MTCPRGDIASNSSCPKAQPSAMFMRKRVAAHLAIALASACPAQAQSNVEGRVGKLESEMRAVQRKVFPGGAGGYLQPQVEAPTTTEAQSGAPATSAVADLSSRVSSLESQLATLTGQVEQATYRSRQVQEAFDAYRRETDARLKALEASPASGAVKAVDRTAGEEEATDARPAAIRPAATSRAPAADAGRAERLTAIAKPDSGDATEDAYLYGYRLWAAKLYPEAQAQLKKAAGAGPTAKRYSFAQNLLGRAYLDDGKPSLASMAFYDNYKKAPDGERAPESLYYLAQSLTRLNKPADACKVYDELGDVYANKLGAKMKADIASGRAVARCKAS